MAKNRLLAFCPYMMFDTCPLGEACTCSFDDGPMCEDYYDIDTDPYADIIDEF